jgi:pyrimidine deaminase RibD-like protein
MAKITEQDRIYLRTACELAALGRKPPVKLGGKVEPTWAAVLVSDGVVLKSETYLPGDSQDAVRKIGMVENPETCSLYLSLEPKAGFDRLPPVTESIRALGVKRVVLGTLDPFLRYQGEGRSTLERLGLEVIMADGEEARFAQQVVEDYGHWHQRGSRASLRAFISVNERENGSSAVKIEKGNFASDAVLSHAGYRIQANNAWNVILDPECWEKPADRTVLYQPIGKNIHGARALPFENGWVDFGALLRDLGGLGILTVELADDPLLFRQALKSGLLDSVFSQVPESGDSTSLLSRFGRGTVSDGGTPIEIQLGDARFLDPQKRSLEARLELC